MDAKMLAKDRGFTLMETMVTVLILAVIMLSVFRVFTATNQTYRRGSESIDGQQNTRAALSWLSRELRSAKSFTVINANEVTFVSDVNVDNQSRTFRLDATDWDADGDQTELLLIRNPADDGSAGPVTDEVAVGIDQLAFTYRDQSGTPTTFRSSVQEVEISVTGRGSSTMRDEDRDQANLVRQIEMSTRVRCRNLGKSVPTLGDVTPPAAPSGLAAIMGCGTATLSWTAHPETDVSGYYLHYDIGGGSPYEGTDARQGPSPIFVGNVTTYTLTGLDLSSTYAFSFQAVDNADNVSSYGNEVTGDPQDSTVPSPPTNLSGRVVGNDRIYLAWAASPEWDVTSYVLRWFKDSDPSSVVTDSTSATSMTVEGLEPDALYHFSVSASDACGNRSSESMEITVLMQPCDQDTDFPDVPGGFTATAGDEFVVLAWTPVSDNDVVGYQVYIEESGSGGSSLLVGNVDHYYVYGLVNGVTYSFQVAALDGCGHTGGYSPLETATPFQCAANAAPPSAPSNLDGRDLGVGDAVRLSWTAGSEGDLLGYTVHWGTDPASLTSSVDAGSSVFQVISGLTAGLTYHFSVLARDVCGNESALATAVAVVPTWGCACPPVASITSPDDFEVLAGMVDYSVDAAACSTATVAMVEFRIDGVTRFVDYSAPYQFNDVAFGWDTNLETRGPHSLAAVVVDNNNCEVGDSTNVFVDNTLIGTACLGIDEDAQGLISGVYGETVTVPMTNLSPVHPFELQKMTLDWNSSNITLLSVMLGGYPLYTAMGFPGLAPGDTFDATYYEMIPAEEVLDLQLSFWRDPYVPDPVFNWPSEDITVATFGNPGMECGPYPVSIYVPCDVVVTLVSENGGTYNFLIDPIIGSTYYSDRTYKLTSMPTPLFDSVLLQTPNADKDRGDALQVRVSVSQNVTAWIAYDPRGTPPNWIKNTYTNTGEVIGVTDTGTPTLGLWKADFPAGQITFSGNKAAGYSGAVGTNYVVFFTCR